MRESLSSSIITCDKHRLHCDTEKETNIVPEWIEHGGGIDAAAEHFGIERERWLDLSTGINPLPYPLPDLARDYWYRLPDAGLGAWLRESAAAYYGVDDPSCVVPAPGSQSLIQLLPRLLSPRRITIVGPTYREHLACWQSAGHDVTEITDRQAISTNSDVVIVTNPNNPDGRVIDRAKLLTLSESRFLIVDEAFADVTPEISLSAADRGPNLLVYRSVGKFFGLAGMRLGFAITGQPLASDLRRALGPWAVSGPAAAVGAVALADAGWIRSTRIRLTSLAGRLDGLLIRSGLKLIGGTSLFRLIASQHAKQLFETLGEAAILVRQFEENPTWLRFGLPPDDKGFDRLATALGRWHQRSLQSPISSLLAQNQTR